MAPCLVVLLAPGLRLSLALRQLCQQQFGMPAWPLASYEARIVDHESAGGLVMAIVHQDPLSPPGPRLLEVAVVTQAWVTKYIQAGTQAWVTKYIQAGTQAWVTKYIQAGTLIALRFGPMAECGNVEMVMENVGVAGAGRLPTTTRFLFKPSA
ncbi:hypothetical protein F4820DRAFT_448635 [Hypoxylon rubiginosum]|uniref:Uncharacterized protein n=1 Tax=Hypoxylon rubiginosum TaxID=110542 RepID=A0ACB9Z0T0_9PEZI|nr:hypothetical protein F4820DRAFT_448635 [Hypoxylon rubiginosum]